MGFFFNKSLTMTYFHRRTSTIIGAKAFHGPVRDGKGWVHLAMVVKRNGLPCRVRVASEDACARHSQLGSEAHIKADCVYVELLGLHFFVFRGTAHATTCKVIGSSRTGN